jgi:phage shock protein E
MNSMPLIVGVIAVLFLYWIINTILKRKKVKEKLADGALVVDVRTYGEFGSGHYHNAINIPVDSISKNVSRLGAKDKPVIVYCASGTRSTVAVGILKRLGFTDVLNAGSLSNLP